MTPVWFNVADAVGRQVITRHRVPFHRHTVTVWLASVEAAASLSVAGVRLAERIVAERLAVPVASIRVAPLLPSGRPIALHGGADSECGVSIAHLRRRLPCGSPAVDTGLVAAAACRGATIGIDLVSPTDISPAALARFLSSDERATAAEPGGAALVWAAKEAAFKASGLDDGFQPRRIVVERLTTHDFAWRARGPFCEVHGTGRFVLDDDHVLAIAVADRPAGHAATAHSLPARAETPCCGDASLP
jgi:phosphopantetheinyl transferase (holo-ACP synthase)